MSIQWTLIAGYLYFEIAVVIILMLPIASPRRWNQFFRSRLFAIFQERAGIFFHVLLGVLCMFLLDSIREMRKYSQSTDVVSNVNLTSEMKGSVKLFRAQRNFYITGFAIFLAFVLRRLVTMIIIQAELLDRSERIVDEAENAKNLAKNTILSHTKLAANEMVNFEDLKTELKKMQELLDKEKALAKDLEAEANKWKTMYEGLAAADAAGDN